VELNAFVPHYVAHPSFQELPPAAMSAINNYHIRHPNSKLPDSFHRLVGLVARVKDAPIITGKKGEPLLVSFFFFFSFSYLLCF
jgi:hypothetical protein